MLFRHWLWNLENTVKGDVDYTSPTYRMLICPTSQANRGLRLSFYSAVSLVFSHRNIDCVCSLECGANVGNILSVFIMNAASAAQ